MRILAIGLSGLLLLSFQVECLAAKAGHDWYPKASDLCAEYVTKMLKPVAGARLVTPTKDPAIAKYVSDFNAVGSANDKGGLALFALEIYCFAHAATKLGDVTAQAVIEDYEASAAKSNPKPVDQSTQQSVAQANPQDAIMQCLQQTAASVTAWCRKTNCDSSVLPDVIGGAQRMQCGYSAIEPTPPPDFTPNSIPAPPYVSPVTPNNAPFQMGFYKGESTQGLSRICYYNVLGDTRAITISSSGTCAPTFRFSPLR